MSVKGVEDTAEGNEGYSGAKQEGNTHVHERQVQNNKAESNYLAPILSLILCL